MVRTASHKLTSRPHDKQFDRYKCPDRECDDDPKTEGMSFNDYHWLDGQKKCLTVDWLADGKVGFVKNQMTCGSCWAFTTAAAIESMHAIKHHIYYQDEVLSLSE